MAWISKVFLQPVERFEDRVDVGFVSFLCGGKPGFVNAVVDGVIDPFVHLINLRSKVIGQEACFALGLFAPFTGKKMVEGGVEHADDFTAFVVDDGF